ncbi:MAG: helicase HerA-like domain-containing protein [Acidimicrobiales bacterium]
MIRTAPDGEQGDQLPRARRRRRYRPRLFSTFLMWLLAELFETLPEAGDLDKPKLVFFFDEAHLLSPARPGVRGAGGPDGAAHPLQGSGVFFVTQLPDDVPDAVLAQLGNRVQHGLQGLHARDAKALKAAVSTYPITDDYDLEGLPHPARHRRGGGHTLRENGAPTPVAWTKVCPPRSQIGAIDPAEVDAMARASGLWATCATEIDRESARELLAARMGVGSAPPAARPFPHPVGRRRAGPPSPATWCATRASRPTTSTCVPPAPTPRPKAPTKLKPSQGEGEGQGRRQRRHRPEVGAGPR